ncbi:hypothetical protein BBJ28_00008819 [Nothophytophthora sp. Chile5]|nr:hypothetical protein BBJ28_00008819 [Nothophytophthora sp. Chile5]
MKQTAFPRDRKRDSLFGGMRKKSLQDLKEQQLALYVEQMPEISIDPVLVGKVKRFLGFDFFFEILPTSSNKERDDNEDEEVSDPPIDADFQPEPHESKFAESIEASGVSETASPDVQHEENVSVDEPTSYQSNAPSSQYSSTEPASAVTPPLTRRRSSAALEDEGEEFVQVMPETDPKAAKMLHKKIVQTVRELVAYDEERVQDFQDQTKDFGREKTSAMEYCAFLLGAVGAQECCSLIPQMARLLPDEEKRGELLLARAAIWRRTHRRHRRRSKQFSESVVLQKQKEEQQLESAHTRMRPKSDSMSALNWGSERSQSLQLPTRSSMIERTSSTIDYEDVARVSESDANAIPAYRAGLADPRRHLNRRPSFNLFGETLQTDPIQEEENPAENESDEDSDDSLLDHPRTSSKEVPSVERNVPLNGNAWTRPSDLGRRNSSFIDEAEDEVSTEDDEAYSSARRSRHRHQNGSSNLDKRTVKEQPLSRGGLTRTRSSHRNSSFVGESDEERGDSGEEPDDSRARFRRSQRRASRKFDEESKAAPAPEEENPVLARLKKQGAINFMMQLR